MSEEEEEESSWEEKDCIGISNIRIWIEVCFLCTGVSLVKFVRKHRKNCAY